MVAMVNRKSQIRRKEAVELYKDLHSIQAVAKAQGRQYQPVYRDLLSEGLVRQRSGHTKNYDGHRRLAAVLLIPLVDRAKKGDEEALYRLTNPSQAVRSAILVLDFEDHVRTITTKKGDCHVKDYASATDREAS